MCGNCPAWHSLTAKQRVSLTLGVGAHNFILKNCPLDDAAPEDSTSDVAGNESMQTTQAELDLE